MCQTLNLQINILILYARIAHVSTRVVCIFHARRVILKRSELRSSLTRKLLVTGMPSPMLKSNQNNCKQNSPRIVVSWRHPLFRASHGLILVGDGGRLMMTMTTDSPPPTSVNPWLAWNNGCLQLTTVLGEFCLQLFWFDLSMGLGIPVTGHFLVSEERSPILLRITHLAWKIQTTLVDTWAIRAYKTGFYLKV